MPARTVRSWSPKSTVSLRSFLDFGISSTLTMVPTLTSSFSTSATEMLAFTGAGANGSIGLPL